MISLGADVIKGGSRILKWGVNFVIMSEKSNIISIFEG